MGRPSRYPEEFRREAVELYRSSDRSRAEIARSLGISDGSLAAWVKQARAEAESGRSGSAGTLMMSDGNSFWDNWRAFTSFSGSARISMRV